MCTTAPAVFATLTERHDARNPLYLQAKTCLREAILARRVGERLPSERDLAKRFGVSFMTARRAVSDLVDEGLLLRRHGRGTFVRDGADARPATAIGVLAGDDPAQAALVSAIRRAACAAGQGTVAVAAAWADLVPIDTGRPCPRLPLAGLIGLGMRATQAADTARAALHLPLVLVDAEAPVAGCDAVCSDHAAAARLAVEHLRQHGHATLAFIGGTSAAADRRAIGFRLAARRLGLAAHEERVLAPGDAAAALTRLLAHGPTALVCADDVIAGACLRHVPRELAVIACDELLPPALGDPRLSTVATPRDELAAMAVRRLLARTAGGALEGTAALVPARLTARGSSLAA